MKYHSLIIRTFQLILFFFFAIKHTNASTPIFQENTISINPENSLTSPLLSPHHLIIGIDGVPYTSFLKAQENGLFQNFKQPSRMISSFPSLTRISWSIMLRNSKHNGYQPKHYQYLLNRTLSNSNKTASFENVPQEILKNKTIIHHHLPYLGWTTAIFRKQLNNFKKHYLENPHPSHSYFILFSTTDKTLHTRGEEKLMELLYDLNRTIIDIQREYNQIHEAPLAVTLISDHGNTVVSNSKKNQLHKILKKSGFKITDKLKSEDDIVDTSYGILSVAPLFMKENRKMEAFEIIARQTEYVDLVITQSKDGGYLIGKESDRLEFRTTEDRESFFITESSGDLLGLEAEGIKAQTWTSQKDIFQASIKTSYPDSLYRIVEGFNDVHHPASIFVTFKEGYGHAASSFFKFSQKLSWNNAGTHGGLLAQESYGVLVSTNDDFPPYIPARDVMDYLNHTFYYPNVTLHLEPTGEFMLRFENRKLSKEIDSIDMEISEFSFQSDRYSDVILKEKIYLPEERDSYLDWTSPMQLKPEHYYQISLRGFNGVPITKTKRYRFKVKDHTTNTNLNFP